MVVNLRASSSFIGAALSKVVNAASFFVSDISDYTKSEILNFLEKKNIESEDPKVINLLEKFDCNNLFNNMDTAQIEALKKCYNYIEATEISLGYRNDQQLDSKNQFWQQKQIYETFQYVSLIETLKLVISHENVWQYIESEKSASDNWLCNFKDDVTFKTHRYFQKYPNALRIQLYYDDLIVNNPSGSKTQSHKIGALYYIIQNLPPHLNSFLGGIHVLALCHTADIEKYGMDAILRPFIYELRKLESDEGVLISTNGKERVLRASLAAVTADGLAAHQLFGLLSSAALYFCRLCMINRYIFHDNQNSICAIPRTKQLHDEHIKIIEEQVTEKDIENARKHCGVKEKSVLHENRYFHFTENYIFDPMHDIFQNVALMEIKLVLNHFITNKEYD
ncbi:unnamed protein product [Lasius platythorax]|uniref:Uncharacterized protein n=1 Tax=Lasius platythorax TaxID=488582 RepID=A0AAV2MXG7_9HYME